MGVKGALFYRRTPSPPPPSFLHLSSQDVNLRSLILLFADKNYCVDYKLEHLKMSVLIVNYKIPFKSLNLPYLHENHNRKRLCRPAATFSVSVLEFLNKFANFSMVYS